MAALILPTGLLRSGRQQAPRIVGAVWLTKRDGSNATNLTSYKRGSGGRSSFNGTVATVFGASGFLGKYLINRLGKMGTQIIIPYRADPYAVRDLKVAGDLGQVLFLPFDLKDTESIKKTMKYSNVVINMIGRDYETKNYSFDKVHVDGAMKIAKFAKEAGVERFIHMSALNASPKPKPIYLKDGSQFLRSKYDGEIVVKEEFPEATIVRPADMYGPEDRFIRYYVNRWRRVRYSNIPLWKKGTETIKMPVFCSDVAEGIVNIIKDPSTAGVTYEAVGPRSYLLSDLVDYFYRIMRIPNFKRIHLSPLFRLKVLALQQAPATPISNADKLDREHVSDVLTGCPTLEDLGVQLMKIEDRAKYELEPFKWHKYYQESVGEFEEPEPPPILNLSH